MYGRSDLTTRGTHQLVKDCLVVLVLMNPSNRQATCCQVAIVAWKRQKAVKHPDQ